ncbi:carbon-nitrogen hydrolase family protein [Citreicella sp. C3M06]|uniref:carbon-nitrogen hydrolase family protein n=1 Tax=Citreicella sp. C3M06 TaxID=2841564 RepID=UPI001C09DB21|nr:carbon-nitrogen hydrolase family protein [Citreicella sp. C3M06]MBU2960817.1 carbon-nitrogen hydrolase family protein [Citreicella sp. C3M06]
MKLALYQGPASAGATEATFATIETQLAAAAAAGAAMLVMPELYLPGYNHPDHHRELSQPRGGAWEARLSGMAAQAGCGLTIGWAEREGDAVYNAATAFGRRGELLGHYRKIQLYGPMERASFVPGDAYCSFDFEGTTCALLICYDIEFSAHVTALTDRGATLFLVPTANPQGFEHVQRLLVPARAAERNITVAYANFCGDDAGLMFGGGSVIAGPLGQTLAAAGTTETLLITDIPGTQGIDPSLLSTQAQDFRKV